MRVREQVIPATLGRLPGVHADVTGMTAGSKDFNDTMKRPPAVRVRLRARARVPAAARDLPVDRGAADGDRAQPAVGGRRLRRPRSWSSRTAGREAARLRLDRRRLSWLPLFLFVVLFGLSMDYHVFILSRVREAYDGGMTTADAVAHGIRSTAGVVTSAAVVMVAVFSIFATLVVLEFKQVGVGLAVAVLLDATIVRGGAAAVGDDAARRAQLVPAAPARVAAAGAPARAPGARRGSEAAMTDTPLLVPGWPAPVRRPVPVPAEAARRAGQLDAAVERAELLDAVTGHGVGIARTWPTSP